MELQFYAIVGKYSMFCIVWNKDNQEVDGIAF